MTTFYCPKCWKELREDVEICPYCGTNVTETWSSMSYEEKLVHALNHPEPTTVMRAAWLLGEKRVKASVPSLLRLTEETKDLYILLEVTRALGKIDTPESRQALKRLAHHPARMIAREALRSLQKTGVDRTIKKSS